jgi:signal transduction histidine kinase
VSVYLKRPIKLVLEAIGAEPLIMPAHTRLPEATAQALDRPLNFVYEPVIVEFGQYCRMVDVYTLLIAQSRLFANLQAELRLANEELETRIELRTAELVKANHDLTREVAQRKQIEQELVATRDQAVAASRFKSELMAKVSHELRTPLGGILGLTEMLQVGVYGPLSPQQEQVTNQIIKSTHYLTDLVNQILDQAKFEAGKLKLNISNVAPIQIVEETVAKLGVLAQAKGLALTIDIAADVPATLAADPMRLKQILLNLVSNALKFTDEGGVHIQLYRYDTGRWAMAVSDTGPGIPAAAQAQIFEPFGQVDGSMTRQHTGTGLGLSIVKQFTTLMGGQVLLESELGQGSTFTVILPLKPVQEKAE